LVGKTQRMIERLIKNAGAWKIYDLKNDINNGEVK
jgi:hypothetical protein